MTLLALRFAAFVVSALVAFCTLIVFLVTAFLTLSPPLIEADTAETIRTWGGMTLVFSTYIALYTYDPRWLTSLRNFFNRK